MQTKERTYDRILDMSIRLFNEFGAPNVTTTAIAGSLEISSGNLYYHFRNKDHIIESLFSRFETEIKQKLLLAFENPPSVNQMWEHMHSMFDIAWSYRFIYRDLSDLTAHSRNFEVHFKRLIAVKTKFALDLCNSLRSAHFVHLDERQIDALATNLIVVATYWLNFAYVCNPRGYTDPTSKVEVLQRGCYQVLSLLAPHMPFDMQGQFVALAGASLSTNTAFHHRSGKSRQ